MNGPTAYDWLGAAAFGCLALLFFAAVMYWAKIEMDHAAFQRRLRAEDEAKRTLRAGRGRHQ